MPRPKAYRCAVCLHEYDPIEIKPGRPCPHCKSEIPMLLGCEDGYVHVNWQDLRVLADYASRFSDRFNIDERADLDKAQQLENILHKLSHYQPRGSKPILDHRRLPATLEINPGATMQPDHTGMTPSPFRYKPNH
jgi:DNA-directed RNA polymerase subunit RPC12/RpoP